jgi:hypothetical protein
VIFATPAANVESAMWTWWEVFATFSGPAATVIAAGTAALITYKFGKIQQRIAEGQASTAAAQKDIAQQQRDIAYDKLKHDLFERRYEIYKTAKELIEYISQDKFESIYDPKLREMRLKLDEARFFFPPNETALFELIEKSVGDYLIGEVERNSAGDDQVARFEAANKMTEILKILTGIYAEFPKLMKTELGFAQLTATEPF